MRQLNYNHLYYFYIVAREGSIAKAAQTLHVTPQTVSGQLATFEEYLGFTLFDRHGKRLHLNNQGRVAYRSAEEIFNTGHQLLETLQAREHGHVHQLTIGVTDVIPKMLTFDFVKQVMKEAKTTRFIFKEGDFETLTSELAINKIDIIIADRAVAPGTSIRAFSHFLGESGISFFAKPNSVDISVGFPQLLHHASLLLPSEKSRMKAVFEGWFDDHHLHPDIVAEFDDSALLKRFGEEGYGIFAAPSIIKEAIISQYHVECVGHTNDIQERYYAIISSANQKRPLIKALIQESKAIFGERSK